MLTPKREKFVQGLFSGLTQREAYKQAYNASKMKDATIDNNAYMLSKKSEVAARLKELQDILKNKNIVTREYVLEGLKEVAERCMQHTPVLDRQGEPTGEFRFDSGGANRSLELLGKHLELFVDKSKTDNTTRDETMSIEDKRKMLRELIQNEIKKKK